MANNIDPSNVVSGGKDVWNISDRVMASKVWIILYELDKTEKIAQFGKENMDDDIPQESIAQNRVDAMSRIPFLLRQLIGNCQFTLERKNKKLIDNFTWQIDRVESVLDGISFFTINDITKESFLDINELHFRKCFNILRKVKDDLNTPLDEAGLIFRKTEEVDLNDLMRNVVEGS